LSRLDPLGWTAELQASFDAVPLPPNVPFLEPARVSEEHRDSYRVLTDRDDLVAETTGRLRHHAASPLELPAVGDWVAVAARPHEGRATIHAVLPRRGVLARKAAGTQTLPQALAANVDTVLVVTSCNQDLSPRRVERALVLAWDAGAVPAVVLNKTDLVDDAEALADELRLALPGVPVHPLSAQTGDGVGSLEPLLAPASTIVLLGSSGVGKSTLTNLLLGEEVMDTHGVRLHDAHGRHTTTSRHLLRLPNGALLIDTPGIREVALWGDADAVDDAFGDIADLAAECRFGDCRHETEPGCAVQAAIEDGELDVDRLHDRRKLEREMARLELKQRVRATWEQRRRNRALTNMYRGGKNAGYRKRNPLGSDS
jgi:ribosome biogenesis GTPase